MKTSLGVALARGAQDSSEHRAILRAISKGGHDRDAALRNVLRLYAVKSFDALPAHVRAVVRDALPDIGAVVPPKS